MITTLTKAQEKQIPKFIEKYVSLSSKPTDRKKATLAVQNFYTSAGFEKPIVIYAQSPFAAAVMVAMCKVLFKENLIEDGFQLDSQLSSQLYSQLSSQLYSQLSSQLSSQLDSQLRSQLSSQLSSQLNSQLSSQLNSQLHSQLYSQLSSQLYSQLRSQLDSQLPKINNDWWLVVWWLVWAGWYAFGKYIGVKFDNEVFRIFMDFVTNVSFIIPYKGIAFVSETPTRISWNNGRLHNETEKAVEYADGYGLYAWNGTTVPEKLILHPEKLTKKDWMEEKNIEVRRCIQEKLGERFVTMLKGKTIHKGTRGELIEIELPNDPDKVAHYVKVKDSSTSREYYLRTPPTIMDADGSIAWTFGLEVETYKPNQEA